MGLYFANISLDGAREAKHSFNSFKKVMFSKVYKALQQFHYFQVSPCVHGDQWLILNWCMPSREGLCSKKDLDTAVLYLKSKQSE